jgi:hypothetical protein
MSLSLLAVDPNAHLGNLLSFHQIWGYLVVIGNGLAGLWALAANYRAPLRTRAMWWFTLFVELAVFVQVASGLGLVLGEGGRPIAFHPFYGFFAIVVIGFLFAYRRQLWSRRFLLYGYGGLFIMGVGIRALITAHA